MGVSVGASTSGGIPASFDFPVNFDGSTNILRGGALTGAPTSASWTGSFFFRRTGGVGAERFVFSDTQATWRCRVSFQAGSNIRIQGRGAGPTIQLTLDSDVAYTDDAWHHAAWSSNGTAHHLYVDRIDVATVTTETGGTIQFAQNSEWSVGARTDALGDYIGDLAILQLWFGTYLDLSDPANLDLLVNATTRTPVDPATAAETLGAPIVLLDGALASWHTNDGTGGGFTVANGALTAGEEEPVRYPVPIVQTEFEAPSGEGDPVAAVDLTGDGFPDILYAQQDGTHFWYANNPAGTFTEHTIRGTTVASAKFEGAIWGDFDEDSEYEAYTADQVGDDIWVHVQDSPGTPTGTWTGAIIYTTADHAQNLRVIDIDGTLCLLCAYEGQGAAAGGIVLLTYDGGGLTDPGNWTSTVITQIEGAWWIDDAGLVSFGGNDVLFFSVRDNANPSAAAPGAYYITKPAGSLHQTWTRTLVHTSEADWLHIQSGNFFGSVATDVAIHDIAGNIKLFNSSDSWAATDLSLPDTLGKWNLRNTGLTTNGRNSFISLGSTGGGLWKWSGSAWEFERWAITTQKVDGPILIVDVDDDATDDFVMADSLDQSIFWVDGSSI